MVSSWECTVYKRKTGVACRPICVLKCYTNGLYSILLIFNHLNWFKWANLILWGLIILWIDNIAVYTLNLGLITLNNRLWLLKGIHVGLVFKHFCNIRCKVINQNAQKITLSFKVMIMTWLLTCTPFTSWKLVITTTLIRHQHCIIPVTAISCDGTSDEIMYLMKLYTDISDHVV